MVVGATVVQPTMRQGTMQSNLGSRQNGGERSQRNQMSELGLVI